MKIGDKVRVMKIDSSLYGFVGEIFSQGNGTCWQIIFNKNIGIGVYFFESELKVL